MRCLFVHQMFIKHLLCAILILGTEDKLIHRMNKGLHSEVLGQEDGQLSNGNNNFNCEFDSGCQVCIAAQRSHVV